MAIKTDEKKSPQMKKAFSESKELFRLPKVGEKIEGNVLSIGTNNLLIDIGPVGAGIVMARELNDGLGTAQGLKIGDKITATVLEQENEDGYVELSLREASYDKVWQNLKDNMKNGNILTTKILDANRGGLIVEINGIFGFLPVSHLTRQHYPRVKNGDRDKILSILRNYINQMFKVKIIDIDKKGEKLILSEKAVEEDKTKECISKFKVGDIVDGVVKGIVDFGAFVGFSDDLEGLIHISELDWKLIDDPNDVIKVGEKVKVKIIDITGSKISLSLRALQKDPWEKAGDKYKVGQKVEGKITKINQFGAFVQLDEYVHGLVHVSEIKKDEKKGELLEVNKKYKFKILSFEPKEHRLGLALT